MTAVAVPDAPLLVLAGDEEVQKDALLAAVRGRAGKDADVLTWTAVPGEPAGAEMGRLLRDLGAAPLFGGRKVVVVRDGDQFLKRHVKRLPALEDVRAGNRLVILCTSIDGRTTFARALAKAGGIVKCERPRADAHGGHGAGSELVAAVHDAARARGLALKAGAAEELAGRTGNDLLVVASELEKLALWSEGRAGAAGITREDVEEVVPRSAAYDQFRLFEEVAVGDAAAALRRIRGMLEEGTLDRRGKRSTDPRAIGSLLVALLHNRLRLLARFRELSARGMAGEELQRELGVRNPGQMYFLKKEASLPLVGRADAAALALADADRALKSSEPAEVVLETLAVRLAALGRNR